LYYNPTTILSRGDFDAVVAAVVVVVDTVSHLLIGVVELMSLAARVKSKLDRLVET
jgi:hypothetical protein